VANGWLLKLDPKIRSILLVVIVVVVNEHMPQGGLSWGRLYTGGSGGGKAR
jgi:hypothetical protein